MGISDLFGGRKPSENAQKIMDFLGCKCEYFPGSKLDYKLMAAYNTAVLQGRKEGFTPIIVIVDKTLTEWFTDIITEDKTPDQIREEILAQGSEGGLELIKKLDAELHEDCEEDEEEFPNGEIDEGDTQECFVSYRDFREGGISETILAYVPTDKPYEVFAWLPFGGWNECPDGADMMKISRYWYEKYGLTPAVIGHDTLECTVAKPLSAETAEIAAKEVFAVCPDDVWQGVGNIGALAGTLAKSTVWYFWWD